MILYHYQSTQPKYHGFQLRKGCIYGRDDKSPFVTYLVRDNASVGTLLLYRLDFERGWHEVWERSATTNEICIYAYSVFEKRRERLAQELTQAPKDSDEARRIMTQIRNEEQRKSYPNRCAQVRNPRGGNARTFH